MYFYNGNLKILKTYFYISCGNSQLIAQNILNGSLRYLLQSQNTLLQISMPRCTARSALLRFENTFETFSSTKKKQHRCPTIINCY